MYKIHKLYFFIIFKKNKTTSVALIDTSIIKYHVYIHDVVVAAADVGCVVVVLIGRLTVLK